MLALTTSTLCIYARHVLALPLLAEAAFTLAHEKAVLVGDTSTA